MLAMRLSNVAASLDPGMPGASAVLQRSVQALTSGILGDDGEGDQEDGRNGSGGSRGRPVTSSRPSTSRPRTAGLQLPRPRTTSRPITAFEATGEVPKFSDLVRGYSRPGTGGSGARPGALSGSGEPAVEDLSSIPALTFPLTASLSKLSRAQRRPSGASDRRAFAMPVRSRASGSDTARCSRGAAGRGPLVDGSRRCPRTRTSPWSSPSWRARGRILQRGCPG